jgi:hypothetical protein
LTKVSLAAAQFFANGGVVVVAVRAMFDFLMKKGFAKRAALPVLRFRSLWNPSLEFRPSFQSLFSYRRRANSESGDFDFVLAVERRAIV